MIGEQIGNYIIEARLGKGGMGVVYRARHAVLGRPAALKVLLPQFTATPEIAQRFFNEARAASSIRHLGIVEIYDFGLLPGGTAFIAMELLAGESLGSRINRRGMALPQSLATIRQICGALGAAHDKGIVHRDLKPDNVFLIPDAEVPGGERIKLLDFGIAKISFEASGETSPTRVGTLIGTPRYMAPEQCRGVAVDHRADIYALGCILYKLITGRPPFSGEGEGDILAAHIGTAPELVDALAPGTPQPVVQLVDRLLAKNPADRPQTAQELIGEIDRLDPSSLAGDDSTPEIAVSPAEPTEPTDAATAFPTQAPTMANTRTQTVRRFHRRVTGIVTAGILGGVALAAWMMQTPAAVTVTAEPRKATSAEKLAAAPEPVAPEPTAEPAVHAGVDAGVAAAAIAAAWVDAAPDAEKVRVVLDSIPRGAHVWLDGTRLGTTPYLGTLPREQRKVVFSLRRDRFKDHTVEASASADIEARVRLIARRAAPAPAPAAAPALPRAPLGDDDTPNPLSPIPATRSSARAPRANPHDSPRRRARPSGARQIGVHAR